MGGAGGILGTDTAPVAAAVAIAAAATIFLFKSGYAFLAPLSFAFCCRRVYALDTRGERERERERERVSSPTLPLSIF